MNKSINDRGTPLSNTRRYINLLEVSKFHSVLQMTLTKNTSQFSYPWFADLQYCWRVPICYEYPSVEKEVLHSNRIQDVIRILPREGSISSQKLHQEATKFFYRMRASLSKMLCKVASFFLFKIFRKIATKVLICPAQMQRIKEAEMKGIPLLYLPLHRSHIDYLMITWVSWHWNLRLPHVASGDNLNLYGLGWLLRGFGAFFIRRRVHGGTGNNSLDYLYRSVLSTYMNAMLKRNLNIEFFLEGTRSRFGKTLLPKNGLISNIVSAVRAGEIADVLLVPVSVSYERVIEGVLVDELKGCEKKRESIWTVICGFFTCFGASKRPCGEIILNFGAPIRLTSHLKILAENIDRHNGLLNLGHSINPNSYRELIPWHGDDEDRTLIRAVGYDVLFQAQQRKSINISSLIAMLVVCKFRQTPVPLPKFLMTLDVLAHEIDDLGFTVHGWSEGTVESSSTTLCARFVLGFRFLSSCLMLTEGSGVVRNENELSIMSAISPTTSAIQYQSQVEERIPHKNGNTVIDTISEDYADEYFVQIRAYSLDCLLELAYFKNCAIAPYILVSMAALTILTSKTGKPVRLTFEECVHRTLTLCNMLQYEVIFCSPCDDLRYEITKALEFLSYDESQDLEELSNYAENTCNYFPTYEDEDEPQNARFDIIFYANILRPFLQTCLVVILDLSSRRIEQVKDVDYIRELIETHSELANITSIEIMPEALNQDSMCNAIKLLRLKGIMENTSLQIIDDFKAKVYTDSFKMFLGIKDENFLPSSTEDRKSNPIK